MMEFIDHKMPNQIKIPYKRLVKKNKKRTIINLKDGTQKILLTYLIYKIDKKNKTVEIPEWYAKKEKLI